MRTLLLALVVGACAARGEPNFMPGSTPVAIRPSVYPTWWRDAERCSGLSGTMRGLRIYIVPGSGFYSPRDTLRVEGENIGMYVAREDTLPDRSVRVIRHIYLSSSYSTVRWVVIHEFLHDLMYQNGLPMSHDAWLFETKCRVQWWQNQNS